tara:strand:- start:2243 stop:4597 length:2355 start_codon:yes stop_codon:yes gene_type:complete
MSVSNNPIQPRSSVSPDTLAGIQQASENEKNKEILAIQKMQIANQAAMAKADREAKSADLKYSTEAAAAQNQLNLAQDTRKWREKNRTDIYMEEKRRQEERLKDLNQKKWERILHGTGADYSNRQKSLGASIDSQNLGFSINSLDPESADIYQKGLNARRETTKKQVKLSADQLEEEMELRRLYRGGGIDSQGNIIEPSGSLNNEILKLIATINGNMSDLENKSGSVINTFQEFLNTSLEDLETNMAITSSVDLGAAQSQGRIGKRTQRAIDKLGPLGSLWTGGGIAGIAGSNPKDNPLYPAFFGEEKGIYYGQEGLDFGHLGSPLPGGDKILPYLSGTQSQEDKLKEVKQYLSGVKDKAHSEITDLIIQSGSKTFQGASDELAKELEGIAAFEETNMYTFGIDPEEYNKQMANYIRGNRGEKLSDNPEEHEIMMLEANAYKQMADGSGQNPLATTNWIEEKSIRPYDLDPTGNELSLFQKGNEGEVSGFRLAHQLGSNMNNLVPELGDDFKTAVYSLVEYNNGDKTEKDLKKLRSILNPITEKNGGLNMLVLDGIFDSMGAEFSFGGEADEYGNFPHEREYLKSVGLGEDAVRSKMIVDHRKSIKGLNGEMQSWAAAWNIAYSGSNTNKTLMNKPLTSELINRLAKNIPLQTTGTDANGQPIMTPDVSGIVDETVKIYTSGMYKDFPENVQNQLIAQVLDDVSTARLTQEATKYVETSQNITDIGNELQDLLLDFNDELTDLESEQVELAASREATRQADMDKLLQEEEAGIPDSPELPDFLK